MASLYRVRTAITGGVGGNELSTHFFDATTGTAQDAADAVRAFWVDLRLRIHGAYTMTVEPLVYTIDSTTGLATAAVGTSTVAVTGGDGNSPIPAANQGLIRWHTGLFVAGRELQGKTFIPGVTGNSSSGLVPNAGYVADLNTAGSNLASSGPITFGIYSRRHHTFAQASSGNAWTQFAVLRSRRS